MNKGLLPIGTVVLLKGASKKLMITGYYSKSKDDDKIYTYNACIFPEGYMENTFCLFDANQIDEVFYKGLENDDYNKYVSKLNPDIKIAASSTSFDNINSSTGSNRKFRRVPKAPTNPLSKSEMLAKYGVNKISGRGDKSE